MSHTLRFSDALGYTLTQLTAMHNASFAGYFFPATMTPEGVADFWRIYQIDARACVVMHDADDTFVGMARVGTRGTRAWCGGFGIAPTFRGTGASHQLAAQMVAVARQRGMTSFQLEVLTQNAAAIKVYERAGLTTKRRLIGLEIATNHLPPGDATSPAPVALATLLPAMLRQDQPDWERELPAISALPAQAVAVTHADGTSSGIIYRHTSESAYILAADLASALTQDTCVGLLRAIAGTKAKLHLFNEPESTRLYQLCKAVSFTEYFSQYEMMLAL